MGETQIYSQRLHGITEKRRILGEVDGVQRELELQKVKLQQLKRKSLRDRWLMDGLVTAPGAEIENPLSETENKIKKLEEELESLHLQLAYLENPELKIENLKKHQESNQEKPLVNGDQSQQTPDQKVLSPSKKEIQKEHQVIQEEDIQPNGEDKKQGEVVDLKQKDPTPIKEVVIGHPVPAPRGIKVSENQIENNQDRTSPDQKHESVDQRSEEEHDKEIQNLNHSPEAQGDRSENLGPSVELKDLQENVPTEQNPESLEKRLEHEEEIVEHLTKELEHMDLTFNVEGLKVDVSQPSVSNEDIRNDLGSQSNTVKITLLDKNDQHEGETQPPPVMEKQFEDQHEPLVRDDSTNKNQDVEEKLASVWVNPDQNEEIPVPVENQDQNEESALPRCQVEPVDPVPVLIGHDKGKEESTSFPIHQSLVQLSSDQEQSTTLPCNDPDPKVSLPCETLVSQVQISQVVVISTPGHTSTGEPAQHTSGSQQGPSTDRHHRPDTTEASTPAENQPLLHKPETDAQSGTNIPERRDKNPPVKKKSCQCCVVM
ncbi:uncharacterized protein RB166_008436 [Leptodactylus fuscus]|uniref:uncharacterized protein LOC142202416 n=1 Tax=Leptodactylus fuscus TaxID=238119 RepID=UPI003F4EA71E